MDSHQNEYRAAVDRLIAEVRQMLANTEYGNGIAESMTQDHEAIEAALQELGRLDSTPR